MPSIVRHLHVHQHHVVRLASERGNDFQAVASDVDAVAKTLHDNGDELDVYRVISAISISQRQPLRKIGRQNGCGLGQALRVALAPKSLTMASNRAECRTGLTN